jgi:hypothetical protein
MQIFAAWYIFRGQNDVVSRRVDAHAEDVLADGVARLGQNH